MEQMGVDKQFVMAKARVKKRLLVWIFSEVLYVAMGVIRAMDYWSGGTILIPHLIHLAIVLLISYEIMIGAKSVIVLPAVGGVSVLQQWLGYGIPVLKLQISEMDLFDASTLIRAVIQLGVMIVILWDKDYMEYARDAEEEMRRMIRWKNI